MKPLVGITGASSGFGRALAKKFSAEGYPVLLMARRIERLEELGLENAVCAKVDVTNIDEIRAAIDMAEAQYGPIDLLVNCAGVMLLGNLENQSPDEWRQMLDVNVMGVMNGMQAVMDSMKERRHGTIVNVSSTAGVEAVANHAAYCASKFGVVGLSEVARKELAPFDVRVIRVLPGAVDTELLGHTTNEEVKAGYIEWREANKVNSITPEDIADTIYFAYSMPQGVNIREIQITDTHQD